MEMQSMRGEPSETYCGIAGRPARYDPFSMECIQSCNSRCAYNFSINPADARENLPTSVVVERGGQHYEAGIAYGEKSLRLSYGSNGGIKGITVSHSGTLESIQDALHMAQRRIGR